MHVNITSSKGLVIQVTEGFIYPTAIFTSACFPRLFTLKFTCNTLLTSFKLWTLCLTFARLKMESEKWDTLLSSHQDEMEKRER